MSVDGVVLDLRLVYLRSNVSILSVTFVSVSPFEQSVIPATVSIRWRMGFFIPKDLAEIIRSYRI